MKIASVSSEIKTFSVKKTLVKPSELNDGIINENNTSSQCELTR